MTLKNIFKRSKLLKGEQSDSKVPTPAPAPTIYAALHSRTGVCSVSSVETVSTQSNCVQDLDEEWATRNRNAARAEAPKSKAAPAEDDGDDLLDDDDELLEPASL